MIKELLNYQEIDNSLKRIENELNSTEEFKKQRQARAYLKEAEDMLIKMDRRVNEINIIIEKTQAGHAELRKLLEEYVSLLDKTEDTQEIRYLDKKTAQLTKTIEIMEKNMNNLVEEVESILKNFDDLKNHVPVAQKTYKVNKEKYDELKAARDGEAQELKMQLSKLAADLNPQYLAAYLKLRSEAVSTPLVPLKASRQCGGCNMEIPSGVISRLDNDSVIICESCRRMVYKVK